MSWRDDARCAGMDPGMFYPEPGSRRSDADTENLYRPARRVCIKCPVRADCLREAYQIEDATYDQMSGTQRRPLPHGIWGGTTPGERHAKNILHVKVEAKPYVDGLGIERQRYTCVRGRKCKHCRPVEERIAILEELFVGTAFKRGLLTRREADV